MSPRTLTRFAVPAIAGAVVLSAAACGGSTEKPAQSSAGPASTTVTRHANSKDHVGGLIASIAGHTIEVTTPDGTASLEFNAMTQLSEVGPGDLSDVAAGSCVSVLPAPGGDGSNEVTAQRVMISASENNMCAVETPPEGSAGPPPPGAPPLDSPPLPGGPGMPPPPPFGSPAVQGAVAAVNGSTIVVTNSDPSATTPMQTNVAVTADTKYDKREAAEAGAIAAGKCVDARGTKDTAGVLQATKIDLGPAVDGRCGAPRE